MKRKPKNLRLRRKMAKIVSIQRKIDTQLNKLDLQVDRIAQRMKRSMEILDKMRPLPGRPPK